MSKHLLDYLFEKLKEQVLAIATELINGEDVSADLKTAATSAVTTIMKGVRISEATALNYDQLAALKETLIEIKEGA